MLDSFEIAIKREWNTRLGEMEEMRKQEVLKQSTISPQKEASKGGYNKN